MRKVKGALFHSGLWSDTPFAYFSLNEEEM